MGIVVLSEEKVRNIYHRIESGETPQEIARRYKVSRAHICKIGLGMTENPPKHARWAHLYPDYLERKKKRLPLLTEMVQ